MKINFRSNYLSAVTGVSICAFSALSQAADCEVIPMGTNVQIVEKYAGGCKDGKADGAGQYTYSFFNQTTKQTVTNKVNGFFKNGMTNGVIKIESSDGREFNGNYVDNKRDGPGKSVSPTGSEEGSWRAGRFWEGFKSGTDSKGVRYVMQISQEKQSGLCRADRQGENGCNAELLNRLDPSATSAGATQTASADPGPKRAREDGLTQQKPAAKQSEMDFFRDLGAGKPNEVTRPAAGSSSGSPFNDGQIADACESQVRGMSIGYRGGLEVFKIEVLPPVKPTQSGLPAIALPQTDLLYPAKIYVHFKNGGARKYITVFIYKTPFGTKCMGAP